MNSRFVKYSGREFLADSPSSRQSAATYTEVVDLVAFNNPFSVPADDGPADRKDLATAGCLGCSSARKQLPDGARMQIGCERMTG